MRLQARPDAALSSALQLLARQAPAAPGLVRVSLEQLVKHCVDATLSEAAHLLSAAAPESAHPGFGASGFRPAQEGPDRVNYSFETGSMLGGAMGAGAGNGWMAAGPAAAAAATQHPQQLQQPQQQLAYQQQLLGAVVQAFNGRLERLAVAIQRAASSPAAAQGHPCRESSGSSSSSSSGGGGAGVGHGEGYYPSCWSQGAVQAALTALGAARVADPQQAVPGLSPSPRTLAGAWGAGGGAGAGMGAGGVEGRSGEGGDGLRQAAQLLHAHFVQWAMTLNPSHTHPGGSGHAMSPGSASSTPLTNGASLALPYSSHTYHTPGSHGLVTNGPSASEGVMHASSPTANRHCWLLLEELPEPPALVLPPRPAPPTPSQLPAGAAGSGEMWGSVGGVGTGLQPSSALPDSFSRGGEVHSTKAGQPGSDGRVAEGVGSGLGQPPHAAQTADAWGGFMSTPAPSALPQPGRSFDLAPSTFSAPSSTFPASSSGAAAAAAAGGGGAELPVFSTPVRGLLSPSVATAVVDAAAGRYWRPTTAAAEAGVEPGTGGSAAGPGAGTAAGWGGTNGSRNGTGAGTGAGAGAEPAAARAGDEKARALEMLRQLQQLTGGGGA